MRLSSPAPPTRHYLMGIAEGPAGIRQTLRLMATLAAQAKVQPRIRQKALALTAHIPPKAFQAELTALFQFVRDRIRYVRDVFNIETVATPAKTLELGAGDCDDKVTLLAALLEAIGFETRYVALAWQPGLYSHVILEAWCEGDWIALDPTMAVRVGWRPPAPVDEMIQNIEP